MGVKENMRKFNKNRNLDSDLEQSNLDNRDVKITNRFDFDTPEVGDRKAVAIFLYSLLHSKDENIVLKTAKTILESDDDFVKKQPKKEQNIELGDFVKNLTPEMLIQIQKIISQNKNET